MDCKKVLLEDILPFWSERLIDRDGGGVFTFIDGNGNVNTEKKHIWIVSRILWTYSCVCDIYGKHERYLEICESAFYFLKKCTLKGGRLPFLVNRIGEAVETKDNLHSECYAAMACAAYYKTVKKDEIMQYARLYFDYAMEHYKKMLSGVKYASQNTFAVHCLVRYTAQFMQGIDNGYRYYSELSLENMLFEDYPLNECGMLLENKRSEQDSTRNTCCPGNIFFAVWMLLAENVQRKDERIASFVRRNLDSMERLYSESESRLIPLSYRSSKEEQVPPYRFWPHWEALVAFTLAARIFEEEKYERYAKLTEQTIFRYFADEQKKLFYCDIDAKGNPIGGGVHGDLFHIPRALMMLDGI